MCAAEALPGRRRAGSGDSNLAVRNAPLRYGARRAGAAMAPSVPAGGSRVDTRRLYLCVISPACLIVLLPKDERAFCLLAPSASARAGGRQFEGPGRGQRSRPRLAGSGSGTGSCEGRACPGRQAAPRRLPGRWKRRRCRGCGGVRAAAAAPQRGHPGPSSLAARWGGLSLAGAASGSPVSAGCY